MSLNITEISRKKMFLYTKDDYFQLPNLDV